MNTQKTQLQDLLARLVPLSRLAPAGLDRLEPYCHVESIGRNLDPFQQKDWSGKVVYLLRGQLKLGLAESGVSVLVGGSGRALLPLTWHKIQPLEAKAITDIELLYFDEELLDVVVAWDQLAEMSAATTGADTSSSAAANANWRLMSGMFAVQKLTEGVFSALPSAHIAELLSRFSRITVKRGQCVIHQGEPGDYYYLIERGRCLVTRNIAGSMVDVAELVAGDAFGEEALVADTVRNATVTMKTSGVLLRLAKSDFIELLREPLLHRLSAEQASAMIEAGARWLDVRYAAEYQQDGLPGAVNIPINEIRNAFTMLDMKTDYIVYCQTGRRSSAAAFLLSQRGFRAYLLEGGLRAMTAGQLERKCA